MKALFIGGTGTISMSITRALSRTDWELTLVNRGNHVDDVPSDIRQITCDIGNEDELLSLIRDESFDVVADFIAFVPEQVHRDVRLFEGRCGQYIFISSASIYQKPLSHYAITESTPVSNPYWKYSQAKIACEEYLNTQYRQNGFPITIVRPSHTYADGSIPLSFHSPKGPWTEIERMRNGKAVILHGDGSSLWTVTHSVDFAKGFIGLMGNTHAIGETVHITSDESLTWNQIYKSIGNALGVEPKIAHISTDMLVRLDSSLDGPLNGDKAHSVVFDNSKIKRLVPGFTATIRFDEGIRQSVGELMMRPELQVPDPDWDAWIDKVLMLNFRTPV
ncbi:MAG: SDR family oxidoreductase [Clostridiaceae bacterium]|jgi:nucleoside-diphosphate-sugar epimerase|nr:SDR family oxidoreductase [Oscillospiraceae bacterium]NLO62360.1 SDR family oxidoreductase [Clostridiaceae bacterium]